MYGFIRILIGAILFSVSMLIIKKAKSKKNQIKMVAAALSIFIAVGLSYLPFENLLYTFKSPEAAFNYQNFSKASLVITGETTDLVIGKNHGAQSATILQKTDNGWKLGRLKQIKNIKSYSNDTAEINVYRYTTSEDIFILITSKESVQLSVSDSLCSDIQSCTYSDNNQNEPITSYFITINKPDLHYKFTVNEISYTIF